MTKFIFAASRPGVEILLSNSHGINCQTLTVLSSLALASHLPLGAKATEKTSFECCENVCANLPLSNFQSRTVTHLFVSDAPKKFWINSPNVFRSLPPVRSQLASGLIATE